MKNSTKQVSNLMKQFWHDNHVLDPVISFNGTTPNLFYQSRFRAFLWAPTYQFSTLMSLDSIACPCCKTVGKLKLNEWIYRPMFQFYEQVWVLHDVIQCKSCWGRCSSIDPIFMSQLPAQIVHRFPFVALIRGSGVHVSMVCHFCTVAMKQVMFGTYTNQINDH